MSLKLKLYCEASIDDTCASCRMKTYKKEGSSLSLKDMRKIDRQQTILHYTTLLTATPFRLINNQVERELFISVPEPLHGP